MDRPLKIGVAGLGRGFTLMLPTLLTDARVQLVAACDARAPARARFEEDFRVPAYSSVEELCADAQVHIVYIATPHQFHCSHVQIAAAAGKHILVEKPMAVSLDECTAMISAARAAGVHLIVGHSHSFDAPIRHTKNLIDSGRYGRVRMITALNFTDFLYRPRRPEELDSERGGGVIHSQAAHQIDIIRLLAPSPVKTVRASTGAWDPSRPTEGAYCALLDFADGAFASATYSGYAHFDSDVLMDNIGETGRLKDPLTYGLMRKRLSETRSAEAEANLKSAHNYGGSDYQSVALPDTQAHQHFGFIIVSCDHADLRPTPTGVAVYADEEQTFSPLSAPVIPRKEVIDEVHEAVMLGCTPTHSGVWARATTEVCLAILESGRSPNGQSLRYQEVSE